ncbi:hypothetical protein [Aminobacter sp. BE322]|uniref:hypothetical protein n=1 Tax=unclassified Aminobacter TaxID=2644704 RepID=UPI003D1F23D3
MTDYNAITDAYFAAWNETDAAVRKADGFGDTIRFSWGLGPDGVDAVVEGTDFATIEGGRLSAITGFLDKVPG